MSNERDKSETIARLFREWTAKVRAVAGQEMAADSEMFLGICLWGASGVDRAMQAPGHALVMESLRRLQDPEAEDLEPDHVACVAWFILHGLTDLLMTGDIWKEESRGLALPLLNRGVAALTGMQVGRMFTEARE